MPGWRSHLFGGASAYVIVLVALATSGVAWLWVAPPLDFYALLPRPLLPVAGSLYVLIVFALCMTFSLFPDIDVRSRGRTLFFTLFAIVGVALLLTAQWAPALGLSLLYFAAAASPHRGWTHSPLTAVAIPVLLIGLPFYAQGSPETAFAFSSAAATGYLSHLVLDGHLFG